MRLTAIVPTLDEEARIGDALADLDRPDVDEILVVDGGSRDGTVARARAARRARVVTSPRGRGVQLALAARHASCDALLFLHADCRLPQDGPARIREALARPGVVAGAFRSRHVSEATDPRWLRPWLPLAGRRSRRTALPYGDQGLFVRAEAYRRVGGFALVPLFEDLDLAHRLAGLGRIEVLPEAVSVSARRYAERPLRSALAVNVLPALWRLGVPPEALVWGYPALVGRSRAS